MIWQRELRNLTGGSRRTDTQATTLGPFVFIVYWLATTACTVVLVGQVGGSGEAENTTVSCLFSASSGSLFEAGGGGLDTTEIVRALAHILFIRVRRDVIKLWATTLGNDLF